MLTRSLCTVFEPTNDWAGSERSLALSPYSSWVLAPLRGLQMLLTSYTRCYRTVMERTHCCRLRWSHYYNIRKKSFHKLCQLLWACLCEVLGRFLSVSSERTNQCWYWFWVTLLYKLSLLHFPESFVCVCELFLPFINLWSILRNIMGVFVFSFFYSFAHSIIAASVLGSKEESGRREERNQ